MKSIKSKGILMQKFKKKKIVTKLSQCVAVFDYLTRMKLLYLRQVEKYLLFLLQVFLFPVEIVSASLSLIFSVTTRIIK